MSQHHRSIVCLVLYVHSVLLPLEDCLHSPPKAPWPASSELIIRLPPSPLPQTRVVLSGEALSILHRRFCGQDEGRAAFMRVAGLAGGDLAPGMLEDIVVEMLALPAVRASCLTLGGPVWCCCLRTVGVIYLAVVTRATLIAAVVEV